MLQKIGDSLKARKFIAWLFLVPLALIFALWGATGIVSLDFFGTQTYAAKVNGQRIPAEQVGEAWRNQQSEWQRQLGAELPESTRTALRDTLLESFIRENLLTQRTDDKRYRVSETRIRDYISQVPQFQVDGQYNENLALARLAQAGITVEQYRADVAKLLHNAELQRGIQVSDFVTPKELERLFALQDEEREVRWFVLPVERFAATAKIDDAAIQAYYEKNSGQFLTPESVKLEYADLRLEQVAAQVVVAETDLQQLYQKNTDRFVDPEKRRARHILINIQDGKDAEALRKAEAILAEARAGKDFASLAQQNSQDSGSAAQGGDLGWAERTQFVGPFSDALFAMQPNEIRGPVKTQFGYHLIKLEAVQPGRARSYEEVRPELEAEFRRDRASDLFGDRLEQVQQRLEQPGAELGAVAKEFGLTAGTIDSYQRGAGGGVLGGDRALDEVVFSDAVLNLKRIGGPVQLGEERFAIVKVLEHRRPAPRPLDEVRGQIVAELRKEQGTAAALAAAESAVARIAGGEALDTAAQALGVKAEPARFVGRGDPSVPAQVRSLTFELPRPKAGAPLTRAIELDQGGAAVVQVTQARVGSGALTPELRARRIAEASSRSGSGDVEAYVAELRRQANVVKNPMAFE